MNSRNVHISDVASMKAIFGCLHGMSLSLCAPQRCLPFLFMSGNFRSAAETHVEAIVVLSDVGIIKESGVEKSKIKNVPMDSDLSALRNIIESHHTARRYGSKQIN